VIAGYSSGGYGALNIALHPLAVFANVQSWSGYFVQRRKCCLAFAHASAAELAYNSPLDYARTLTRAELARYLTLTIVRNLCRTICFNCLSHVYFPIRLT